MIFKKILKGVWSFSLEKGWNWVWSKTTIDEKVEAAVEEAGRRFDNVKQEAKDVIEAVKEVGNQIEDVAEAASGKKRRGRPKKKKDA